MREKLVAAAPPGPRGAPLPLELSCDLCAKLDYVKLLDSGGLFGVGVEVFMKISNY